jgi:hypothetical protein
MIFPFSPRAEQDIFDDLASLCVSPGYVHAIAFFCFRDQVVGYGDVLRGKDYAKLFSFDRLIRTEISTLIGLMLRAPRDLLRPDEKTLQQYLERTEALLKELHQQLNEPGRAALTAAIADPMKSSNPFTDAETLREPIFYAAESAFSSQYRDLSVLKYEKDDAWLTTNKGFSAAQAKIVISAISDFLNNKLLKHLDDQRRVRPDQWTLLGGFEFTAADLANQSGLGIATVAAVLAAFCFPDDRNLTFTALNEFNAANAFPIIKVNDGKYALFLYTSLVEALYESPFYWMQADKYYNATAMANRGRFAEGFTADRLEKVFGQANVLRNVDIWQTKARKKKLGEIDTLVLFGDRAIVLQSKSKKLNLASRKGNDLQLRADFKAAVQDACDQAMLCARELVSHSAIFTDAHGNEITIPSLKQVYPVCVVSDHYPALSFQARQFLTYRTTSGMQVPLVCDVFFVDVVTEFLETPLRFLSYLELRAQVGENISLSHEITALAFHLKRNLWLGGHDFIALEDDISADVDVAMAVRRDGLPGERTPPGILTSLKGTAVGRIIDQIEHRSEAAAIGVGLELLRFSGKSVNELSRGIEAIVTAAAKDNMHHDITVASSEVMSGITVHSNSLPLVHAAERLRRHCELRKYSVKAGTWAGLLLEPGTASIRTGGLVESPWKQDDEMDAATANMTQPQPIDALRSLVKQLGKRTKTGRNEKCHCGSGKKYKKCHLLSENQP